MGLPTNFRLYVKLLFFFYKFGDRNLFSVYNYVIGSQMPINQIKMKDAVHVEDFAETFFVLNMNYELI